jgi:general stress protein 26
MEPFAPSDNLVVWLGTNSNSRKVKEIRNNSKVCLYYSDNEGGGYIVVNGIARIVDNPEDKTQFWRKEWETLFPRWKDHFYALIEVTPTSLEILSYKHGIVGDPETWSVPHIDF